MNYIKIIKAKTRPIQLEPWFYRYLNAGQLKVLSAIIAHADYATRNTNSFASNKTIAFYAGFGLISENTKEYEELKKLNDDEASKYKAKKLKNAIQTVKNVKAQLETLGVIKREIVDGKSYAVVDLDWSKEKYLSDFEIYFNNIDHKDLNNPQDEIKSELDSLVRLTHEGNISNENLAKQLDSLSDKLKPKNNKSADVQSSYYVKDVDKLVDHIMSSENMSAKIRNGIIKNPDAYKHKVKGQILNGSFNGVNQYYGALIEKERESILDLLKPTCLPRREDNEELYCDSLSFEDNHTIAALYKSNTSTLIKKYGITPNLIKDVLTIQDYTQPTQIYISNYSNNYKNAIKIHNGDRDE